MEWQKNGVQNAIMNLQEKFSYDFTSKLISIKKPFRQVSVACENFLDYYSKVIPKHDKLIENFKGSIEQVHIILCIGKLKFITVTSNSRSSCSIEK
jgi:hypothetical protein